MTDDPLPSHASSATPIGSPDAPVITSALLTPKGSTEATVTWTVPDDQGSAILGSTVT